LGLIGFLLGMGNPSSAKDSLKEMQHRVGSMLPTGAIEIFVWVLLSSTAGFCEEVIYRGYFQRQIAGLFNSAWAGIVLQGIIFGGSHAYEGWQKMVQIGVFGILFGVLAHWRKSLRPGMIGHALFDIFQGIVGAYVLRNADKLLKK
jgi:membrane protease YdiL (CAAX protease family)